MKSYKKLLFKVAAAKGGSRSFWIQGCASYYAVKNFHRCIRVCEIQNWVCFFVSRCDFGIFRRPRQRRLAVHRWWRRFICPQRPDRYGWWGQWRRGWWRWRWIPVVKFKKKQTNKKNEKKEKYMTKKKIKKKTVCLIKLHVSRWLPRQILNRTNSLWTTLSVLFVHKFKRKKKSVFLKNVYDLPSCLSMSIRVVHGTCSPVCQPTREYYKD